MRTMTKRFYLGSKSVSEAIESSGHCVIVKTLPEVITEAKQAVEDGDDVRYIVEIIKIVRRQQTPVIVEDVRRK